MNAVEIEEAVSALADETFSPEEFPFQFLEAFGNKATTIKRLRSGTSNKSDVKGVLQRNHIHILIAEKEGVGEALSVLRDSAATIKQKARFIVSTDGNEFQAEDMVSGETVVCDFNDIPDHFGFFLPLAGITTISAIRESAFDIKATGRLNRLYLELLKDNPDWGTQDQRTEMNHFVARLIFCFFAEDTDIFTGDDLFTSTLETMSDRDSSNTHEVLHELFRAMDTSPAERESANIPRWADVFPYVNGGLFGGSQDVPYFSRRARSYLLHIGKLDWTKINPDIFGSMIQAVADDEERGSLGMHYTSVPNILKVLNPLFLDDLRLKLDEAGDSPRKLLNLRARMAKIRVFDPACGSGNFLVIAYKEMREIEGSINARRGEAGRKSDIPLTNFRGIELRDFPAEIARLSLIIAEYQCDLVYRGQKEALQEFLPLEANNWITCGNALQLDWSSICPPTGMGVKHFADDLFEAPLDQAEIDFENEGGETYICGNPPYLGSTWQSKKQKAEIRSLMSGRTSSPGFLDYVSGWFIKAADWLSANEGAAAFVSTNSICQGQMVPLLWPAIFDAGSEISFGHRSFRWSNLASNKAGVTVVIVGLSKTSSDRKFVLEEGEDQRVSKRYGDTVSPYLVLGSSSIVEKRREPLSRLFPMEFGNKPSDGGHLLLTKNEVDSLDLNGSQRNRFVRRIYGSKEFIHNSPRYCIWIEDRHLEEANRIQALAGRIEKVRATRLASKDKGANALAARAHQLKLMRIGEEHTIAVAAISSENRQFLPVGLLAAGSTTTNKLFALYDAPIWNMAIVASRLHWVWIGTVCVRMRTDFSYSNTLGWNTFPLPSLTEKNKSDLTRCAEEILLTRETHFPATIADLYDPEKMPDDLRAAHDRNDETLERIFIGRRFKNDTERLEKLFELYAKMIAASDQKRA